MSTKIQNEQSYRLTLWSGLSGILSVVSYIVNVFMDLPLTLTFLLAMLFPICGIIFLFGVKEYIAEHRRSAVNELSFIFGSLAFAMCAIFLSAQVAVESQINLTDIVTADHAQMVLIKKSLRLIDMGIDVAWDMFIGMSLVLFMLASWRINALRIWGFLLGISGFALMVINSLTFPIPPADAGLIDLGPLIALSLLSLAIKLITLGTNDARTTDAAQH